MRTKEIQNFVDSMQESIFGRKADNLSCVSCNSTKVGYDDFKDNISRKEFTLSGLCQKCQDEVFG